MTSTQACAFRDPETELLPCEAFYNLPGLHSPQRKKNETPKQT